MGSKSEHTLGKGQLFPQKFLFKRPTRCSVIMSKKTCTLPSFNILLVNHKKNCAYELSFPGVYVI